MLEERVRQQLDPATINQMARQLGVSDAQVQQAAGVGVPLLLAALARNTSSSGGAQALSDALTRDHDGSVLQHKQDAVTNDRETGARILDHVLGAQQAPVASA